MVSAITRDPASVGVHPVAEQQVFAAHDGGHEERHERHVVLARELNERIVEIERVRPAVQRQRLHPAENHTRAAGLRLANDLATGSRASPPTGTPRRPSLAPSATMTIAGFRARTPGSRESADDVVSPETPALTTVNGSPSRRR